MTTNELIHSLAFKKLQEVKTLVLKSIGCLIFAEAFGKIHDPSMTKISHQNSRCKSHKGHLAHCSYVH